MQQWRWTKYTWNGWHACETPIITKKVDTSATIRVMIEFADRLATGDTYTTKLLFD